MKYKHIPGGLFPHFDCGFERRPAMGGAGSGALHRLQA